MNVAQIRIADHKVWVVTSDQDLAFYQLSYAPAQAVCALVRVACEPHSIEEVAVHPWLIPTSIRELLRAVSSLLDGYMLSELGVRVLGVRVAYSTSAHHTLMLDGWLACRAPVIPRLW